MKDVAQMKSSCIPSVNETSSFQCFNRRKYISHATTSLVDAKDLFGSERGPMSASLKAQVYMPDG